MKVIFLDVDGVLNSEQFVQTSSTGLPFGDNQIDPEAVERLNQIIERTGAKVVISSSWRHVWSRGEIVRMLGKRGFRHPDAVVSITPSLLSQRGDEVADWLGNQGERGRIDPEFGGVESYVILDDSSDFNPDQREHFVQTDADIGLTDEDARRAIFILGSK